MLTTSWENRTDMNLSSSLYKSFSVDTNKLTFVGINTASAAFDSVEERNVLAMYIDKEKLASDIMLGSADVATSPVREDVYFNKKNEEKLNRQKSDMNIFCNEAKQRRHADIPHISTGHLNSYNCLRVLCPKMPRRGMDDARINRCTAKSNDNKACQREHSTKRQK